MATDLIRYDLLYQDAMRGIVRRVLADVAREGLPGEHHFFISFRTHAPGVRLSARMRKQYPETMTIVLQHQFWGLAVSDVAFEVGLSFHGEAETLHIPFDAIVGFFDPSVDFGLKIVLESEAEAQGKPSGNVKLVEPEAKSPHPPEKTKPRGSGSEPATVDPTHAQEERTKGDAKPADTKPAQTKPQDAKSQDSKSGEGETGETRTGETKVVSLESFRKKP